MPGSMPGLQFAPFITLLALVPIALLTWWTVAQAGRASSRLPSLQRPWLLALIAAALAGLIAGQLIRVLAPPGDLTLPPWILPMTALALAAALLSWISGRVGRPIRSPSSDPAAGPLYIAGTAAAAGPLVAAAMLLAALAGFLFVPTLPPIDAIRVAVQCGHTPYAAKCESSPFVDRATGLLSVTLSGSLEAAGTAPAVCNRQAADGSATVTATVSTASGLNLNVSVDLLGDGGYRSVAMHGTLRGEPLVISGPGLRGLRLSAGASWLAGELTLSSLHLLVGIAAYSDYPDLAATITWSCDMHG